jgi:hypothetical protein
MGEEPSFIDRARSLRWNVIAPVGLLAIALASVAWFDLTSSGSAEPPPLLGQVGTPVRGTFTPPTATAIGAKPTPKPRPTIEGAAPGTPADRDHQRQIDLITMLAAFNKLKDQDGSFPSTNGNVQTLCVFKDLDVGCKLKDVIPSGPPQDPLGSPIENGYWFSSDGSSLKIYASMEQDVPSDQQCQTDNVDLLKKSNLICLTVP